MDEMNKKILGELGARIGSLEIDNAALKVQVEMYAKISEDFKQRLLKYENEEGVPHGDDPKKKS